MSTHLVMYQLPFQTMILSQIVQMSISDSQQKREAVVEDFRTIRLSNGRNLTEDTPQTAVSPWNYPSTRSCGFSQVLVTTFFDTKHVYCTIQNVIFHVSLTIN